MLDVIVIGAGPAGTAAAVQLKRFGLKVIVLEKEEVGGLIRSANLVENYPGYPDGISGTDFAADLARQLCNHSIPVIYEEVVCAYRIGSVFAVRSSAAEYQSKSLVIASGTVPRVDKGIEIAEEVSDKVFNEVTYLQDFKCKTVAIIGAGDAAFDYALNLSQRNTVVILNRGDAVKCLPLLFQRCKQNPNITYLKDFRVKSIQPSAAAVIVKSESQNLCVDNVLFAIGREPQENFLSEELRLNGQSIAGYEIVGDVKNGMFRQTSIAVGDGVKSAMKVYSFIMGNI